MMMKIAFKPFNLKIFSFCNKYGNTNTQNPHHHHLRIADVLLQDEDEEEEVEDLVADFSMDGCRERRINGCTVIDFSSPRRIVAKWLSGLRKGKDRKIGLRNEEESNGFGGGVKIRCSTNELNGKELEESISGATEPGFEKKETSFNLGVGCYLLYLIAASRNEIEKMVELRAQIESHIEDANKELQRTDLVSKPSDPTDIFAYTTTDASESLHSNNHTSSQNVITDQSSKCGSPKSEDIMEGMDQLEAELEAELENLQVHLDNEKLLKHKQQQRIEVTIKDSASSSKQSLSQEEVIDPQEAEEVIDPQEADSEMQSGVHPYELERRLHELLEVRQEEQIRELEAALECAKHKLQEKDMEISWWKDTAQLITHRVVEPSRLTSRSGKETYRSSR